MLKPTRIVVDLVEEEGDGKEELGSICILGRGVGEGGGVETKSQNSLAVCTISCN